MKDFRDLKTGDAMALNEKDEPEIFYQLSKVLRARSGEIVVLLPMNQDNSGPIFEYEFDIFETKGKNIALTFTGKKENINELKKGLQLLQCLPNKPEKLDMIVQKAVELGAEQIILLKSDHTQFKHGIRLDRLEKIIVEAAEQSERAIVPKITDAGDMKNYLGGLREDERSEILAAMEREGGDGIDKVLSEYSDRSALSILVGPEGGFSEEEKQLLERMKIKTFTLGRRILRTETAAILSLGIASFRLG